MKPLSLQVQVAGGAPRIEIYPFAEVILGSDTEAGVFSLPYEGVAPRHAWICLQDGILFVEDLGSAGGTLVNGMAITGRVEVHCPASVHVGEVTVVVGVADESATVEEGETRPVALAAAQTVESDSTSTLRLVHDAAANARQPTASVSSDMTGRIHHLPPEGHGQKEDPVINAEEEMLVSEQTIAFAMDTMDTVEAEMEPRLPASVDYDVKEEIAKGGMGKIFAAQDPKLERIVALKVSTVKDRKEDAQFFTEAKVLAQLAHPNIVPIHNLGMDGMGRPFYSMKLVKGRTLQSILKLLRSGDAATLAAYPRSRLLSIFCKVCDAVGFAHASGYLHRDLKPENIMVGEFGEVLVMDWGLAKRIRGSGVHSTAAGNEPEELEKLAYIEGTPQYMSPEQADGVYGGLDERSDIYSLGGVLYAILTMRPPVSGASVNEVLEKVRKGETTTMALPRGSLADRGPAHLDEPVPESLRAVTLKAMACDREKRYPNVAALVKDIDAYQNGFATSAEDASMWTQIRLFVNRHRAASALAAALLVGGVLFTVRLAASESLARANALRADASAEEAKEQAALAKTNATRAEEKAREALLEKESAQRFAASAQIALAEVAEQKMNTGAMLSALEKVPEGLRNQEWRYLNARIDDGAFVVQAKNLSPWNDCVPSPVTPGVLVTLQADGWIRTLNLNSGGMEDLFNVADYGGYGVLRVSEDGQTVVVKYPPKGSIAQKVAVFQLRGGKKKFAIENLGIGAIKLNAQGNLLMVFSRTGVTTHAILVYEMQSGSLLWQMPCETPFDADFSEDGKNIDFVSGKDGYLESFSATKGELSRARITFDTKGASALGKVLSLQGKFIFQKRGPTLRVIDWTGGNRSLDVGLRSGSEELSDFLLLPKSSILVTLTPMTDTSAALEFRDSVSGLPIKSIPTMIERKNAREWRLCASPKSDQVAVFRGAIMKVWAAKRFNEGTKMGTDASTGGVGFVFLDGPDRILHSTRRPNEAGEDTLALDLWRNSPAGFEKQANVWVEKNSGFSEMISTNRRGNTVAEMILSGDKALLKTYSVGSQGLQETLRQPAQKGDDRSFELSPKGERYWWVGGFYETATGKLLKKTATPKVERGLKDQKFPQNVHWTDDSHVVDLALVKEEGANIGSEKAFLLWSVEDEKAVTSVPALDALCHSVAFDGQTIVEGGEDQRIRIRDAKTLMVKQVLRVHEGPVNDVACHPTLPLVATASSDWTVKIWDLRTNAMVEEFSIFSELPIRLKWSPDGTVLSLLTRTQHYFVKPKVCQNGAQ